MNLSMGCRLELRQTQELRLESCEPILKGVLDRRERRVLNFYYGWGWTLQRIAKRLKLSNGWVGSIRKKAIEKLRRSQQATEFFEELKNNPKLCKNQRRLLREILKIKAEEK